MRLRFDFFVAPQSAAETDASTTNEASSSPTRMLTTGGAAAEPLRGAVPRGAGVAGSLAGGAGGTAQGFPAFVEVFDCVLRQRSSAANGRCNASLASLDR